RIGTPAMTSQGMKAGEAEEVAMLIARALQNRKDDGELAKVSTRVGELAAEFPPYPHDFVGHV
ncbi:MAG TPA: serine hydroxymethyltransferase, partial [Acidimicrobiia bacterium]|nr:serine hydroxymethyltransferase [Acidimicrobiia bacterium]